MLLLGCKPPGRNTEQHDIFFAVGNELKELVPAIVQFWPEAKGKLHIDAWREVTQVDGYAVSVIPRTTQVAAQTAQLFFINLGGYKQNDFEEYHYKMIVAATDKGVAIQRSKETAFYKHTGFKGATSHVDDKYGIDVDDLYEITDILPEEVKENYMIQLLPATEIKEDMVNLGYFKLDKLG